MKESDTNIYPEINLLPHPIRKAGEVVRWLFAIHLLSPVSEHFGHSLDEPLEQVIDRPAYQESLFDVSE